MTPLLLSDGLMQILCLRWQYILFQAIILRGKSVRRNNIVGQHCFGPGRSVSDDVSFQVVASDFSVSDDSLVKEIGEPWLRILSQMTTHPLSD
jgi:hypothetical protein